MPATAVWFAKAPATAPATASATIRLLCCMVFSCVSTPLGIPPADARGINGTGLRSGQTLLSLPQHDQQPHNRRPEPRPRTGAFARPRYPAEIPVARCKQADKQAIA